MSVVKPPFQTDDFLKVLLWNGVDEAFKEVLAHAGQYQLQITYVQVDRDENGKPLFRRYHYHENPDVYFYPASTVKLPLALAALEKLHRIGRRDINKYTPIVTGGPLPDSPVVTEDATAPGGKPTIAHYIRKMLSVSDNDAANRLYEFIGQGPLNRMLHAKGYNKTDILHRLDLTLTEEQNAATRSYSTAMAMSAIFNREVITGSLTRRAMTCWKIASAPVMKPGEE